MLESDFSIFLLKSCDNQLVIMLCSSFNVHTVNYGPHQEEEIASPLIPPRE